MSVSRPLEGNDKIEVRIVKGKGRGIFATKDISKDTIILCELPEMAFEITAATKKNDTWILRWAFSLIYKETYGTLIPGLKQLLQKLHPMREDHQDVEKTKEYIKTVEKQWLQTVGQKTQTNYAMFNQTHFAHVVAKLKLNCIGADDYAAIYATATLLNHSCQPNAEWGGPSEKEIKEANMSPDTKTVLIVKALEDIQKGDEITICYSNLFSKEKDINKRKELISRSYFFNCTCPLCSS